MLIVAFSNFMRCFARFQTNFTMEKLHNSLMKFLIFTFKSIDCLVCLGSCCFLSEGYENVQLGQTLGTP